MLAPIVLFVYNRPWHTQQTVEALQRCELAAESDLYIFADGFKADITEEQKSKISEVRKYIHAIDGFRSVTIEESKTNKGLANSVISGITKVIEKHGKVIVVEDDIVVHPFFLRFMNDVLECYREDKRIFTIGATSLDINIPTTYEHDIFIAPRVESWGWGTWHDRWITANWDTDTYPIVKHPTKKRIRQLCKGGNDFWPMLQGQASHQIDSWAVRWQYNMAQQRKYCIYPTSSLVKNIGLDGTGVNCGETNIALLPNYNSKYYNFIFNKDIKPNQNINKEYENYYQAESRASFMKRFIKHPLIGKAIRKIRKFLLTSENEKMVFGFFGDYSSFEEVSALCNGYSANNIIEATLSSTLKVKNGEAIFERDSFIFDKIQYSYPLLACLFKVAVEHNNKLRVLDFGGALGSHYYQNKEFLQPIHIEQWTVVEQLAYVNLGNEKIADGILDFAYNIEDVKNANILLSSSTLQYMEEPYLWAKKFIDSGIDYILLDRIQFNAEKRDRLTLQTVPPEIYNAQYPSWFLIEEKLIEIMREKYDMILDFDSTIDRANIPSYYKGFLFKKR